MSLSLDLSQLLSQVHSMECSRPLSSLCMYRRMLPAASGVSVVLVTISRVPHPRGPRETLLSLSSSTLLTAPDQVPSLFIAMYCQIVLTNKCILQCFATP